MIPGPRSRSLGKRLRRVESRNITYLSSQFPVFWQSAQDAWVRDVDGHRYLDLSSAFAAASLGHRHPIVQRALIHQSHFMWHGMGDVHPNASKVELLEWLAKLAPGALSVSILSSSGSEAVESALKTAFLATGRPGIIAFDGAYHGLSYGTLPVTDRPEFTRPFLDQIPKIAVHLPFPDPYHGTTDEQCLEAIQACLRHPTAPASLPHNDRRTMHKIPVGAILVEPVQGRGGVRVASPAFLKELRALARRYDVLLICDEIWTGFGRTGKRFAVDHASIVPDLLCVGKALANGFPLSACIGTPKIMRAWPPSDGEAIHTSTFLGNPLGCAMAVASLSELEKRKLSDRSARLGAAWKAELQMKLGHFPAIGEIRGLGLAIGIELVKDRKSKVPDPSLAGLVVKQALKKGLILLSGGKHRHVLTLTPPLTIPESDLSLATDILQEVFDGTS